MLRTSTAVTMPIPTKSASLAVQVKTGLGVPCDSSDLPSGCDAAPSETAQGAGCSQLPDLTTLVIYHRTLGYFQQRGHPALCQKSKKVCSKRWLHQRRNQAPDSLENILCLYVRHTARLLPNHSLRRQSRMHRSNTYGVNEELAVTQKPSPVIVGQPVTFTCNGTFYKEEPIIEWYLDPRVLNKTANKSSSPNIHHPDCVDFLSEISFTPERDHACLTVKCQATSPYTILTENATLEIQAPPTTSEMCVWNSQEHVCHVCENCSKNASVGESLGLECTAKGSIPVSHLIWQVKDTMGGLMVHPNTDYSETYNDASWSWDVISKAKVDISAGERFFVVTCQVLHPDDTIFTEKHLTVFVEGDQPEGPVGLYLTNDSLALIEGQPVAFRCTAVCVRRHASYHFRWYVNGTLHKSEEDEAAPAFIRPQCYDYFETFIFTPSRTDAGKRVKCVVSRDNGVDIQNISAPLQVSYNPRNTAICVKSRKTCDSCRNCTRNATVGENLELRCFAVGSNPACLLTWEVRAHNSGDQPPGMYHRFSSTLQDNITYSWYSESTIWMDVPTAVNSFDVVCNIWYPDRATLFKVEHFRILVKSNKGVYDINPMWKVPVICVGSAAMFVLVVCICSLAVKKWARQRRRRRRQERYVTNQIITLRKQNVPALDVPASTETSPRVQETSVLSTSFQVPETSGLPTWTEFEFPRSRVRLQEIISYGFYGRVVKAKANGILKEGESTTVAVKILRGHTSTSDFKKELEIVKHLEKHPCVVSFLGCCTDKDPFYMIMEYVPNGTLEAYITKKRVAWTEANLTTGLMKEAMSPIRILMFAFQIASGMEYLSSMNASIKIKRVVNKYILILRK